MQIVTLARTFTFDNNGQSVKLSDIDPKLSPEAVINFYSQTYPILTTAKIEGPEIADDEIKYTFVTTMGTKG